MIIDNIKNAGKYEILHRYFKQAILFLTENDLENLEVGKHEIDGDNLFALVQVYNTNTWENTNWETHDKYIDIQYILQGKERIGWCDAKNLTIKENRLENSDIIIYEQETEYFTDSILSGGEFAIYFPTDAHRPGGCFQQPEQVKKIVIKVKR